MACLLCRGFISVAEGDRARYVLNLKLWKDSKYDWLVVPWLSHNKHINLKQPLQLHWFTNTRFVDHMHSEHEVKHEPEVILAVSVNWKSQLMEMFGGLHLLYKLGTGFDSKRETLPDQDRSRQVWFSTRDIRHHLIIWSSDYLIIIWSSSDHLIIIWSSDYLIIWPSDQLIIWSLGWKQLGEVGLLISVLHFWIVLRRPQQGGYPVAEQCTQNSSWHIASDKVSYLGLSPNWDQISEMV